MTYTIQLLLDTGTSISPTVKESLWNTRYIFSNYAEVTVSEKTRGGVVYAIQVIYIQKKLKDKLKLFINNIEVKQGTHEFPYSKPQLAPSPPKQLPITITSKPLKSKQKSGKTKILYLTSCTHIGGQETVLKRLLKNIDKSLYEVHVLVTHEKGYLHHEFEVNSDKLIYVTNHQTEPLYQTILNLVSEEDYDYIHFFNLWIIYDVIPRIKQMYPRSCIIASIFANLHNDGFKETINKIRGIQPYLWALTTDAYTNKKVFPDITITRNGIPQETFYPAPKQPKTVSWVGRLTETKKINLIPVIAKNLPIYKFTIIGDRENTYSQKIRAMQLPNIDIKTGLSEEEVADITSKSEYFIFTSQTESMPLTVLEALASGCCVITENVGDIPNVIQNGVNGYIVPEGEDTTTWISKNLPNLKPNGDAARRTILDGFTVDQMVKRYEFLYGKTGKHKEQTHIAFIWGVLPPHGIVFWNSKIDSHQQAIAELSKNNVVQVFAPSNQGSSRKILNAVNHSFYDNADVGDLILQLKDFKPDMIFLNMFGDPRWPSVVRSFPNVWKALVHYGETNLSISWSKDVNLFIVQQEYLRKRVAEANNISIDKVVSIPFTLEQWLFKPLNSEKAYDGIMVADFRRDIKRQHLLLEAWAEMPKDSKLVLVGYYERSIPLEYPDDCKALAQKLGIGEQVTFINGFPHEKLPELINKARIGFLTSSHEGGSRALIEMMACGLPVIVLADCEGNIHMLKDGVEGYIAEPNPHSIAQKTKQLLQNYASMGKTASERVRKQYPYHMMTSQYFDIVQRERLEVSIITTSMNRGKYLEENIESIMSQTLKTKVNHIIMDGGSTDNTLQLLEKYRDNVYSYIKRDLGQTDSILRAIRIIETEFPQTKYVGWINADDYYEPNWLSGSLPVLDDSPPDVAMLCSDAKQVTEKGEFKQWLGYTSEQYITLELLARRGNIIVQPTVLIRLDALREIRDKTGMTFNPNYNYCQDLELWIRFLKNGYRIRKLNGVNVTANLRSHNEQMSLTHTKEQCLERDKLLIEICDKLKITNPPWVRR